MLRWLALTVLVACSSPREAIVSGQEKVRAPVDVSLRTSGRSGRVVATLTVTARSPVPQAVSRFVLPTGVVRVEGALESELGPLAGGETRSVRLVIEVPKSGGFVLLAGVDARMNAGLQLHAGTSAPLGEVKEPSPAPGADPLPKGDGVVGYPTEAVQ